MEHGRLRRWLGLSPWLILGLALLMVPRVVVHDLGLATPLVSSILLYGPLAGWLIVVLRQRVPNAFRTLLVVGVVYGVILATTHQILWSAAFDGDPPSLGGNLAGTLSPTVEAVVMRGFAFLSSIVTGAITGAATGVVGWLLARFIPGLRPRRLGHRNGSQ